MPHAEVTTNVEEGMLEPIAIVGMACHLPGGVDSAGSLWNALENKRSLQTPKVPANRFNIDAYLHEKLDRPGSFNVPGGYFLDGAPEDFDPTFFNMTPIEAMWLDPQQRKMLEVTYECLESAGLSIEAVKGSNTAVFVGSFTSDYQQMSTKEGDFRHNYAATGVDTGLISARIGNTFDLNGPSFTINTACSSSIYAIHNACHALRTGDATAAIAGGVNLILTVDQHMNTAKLGILSPTSTCHTFDASADGYGRAEGAGALYLKLLSDAIRDGDPVRGVIRSSAVNTNGKVANMGITHPSGEGQERVVRQAYARSGLDPNRTAYVECHGTGTPVGDPIEARAVAKAMNDTRATDAPLLIGAIKANIGHSEAASGIFAVMKAAMMTEAAVIPGVCGLRNLNPAIDEKDWNIEVNVNTTAWPTGFAERRAGVSSFGYGGTNGHVVVEAIDSLVPFYSHGQKRGSEPAKAVRPFILPFSAHDRTTLERNITAYGKVAADYHAADLAYTLSARRSNLCTRGFNIVSESIKASEFDLNAFTMSTYPADGEPGLAFIFTGQGSTWSGMGAQAMATFESFRSTVRSLDQVLQQLDPAVRPTWTLESALSKSVDGDGPDVNKAEVAQPVCTAVQIAMVDLLSCWDISPLVTVGHSSGEIAAAYAAGRISAPEAMIAAFLRGYAVQRHAPVGSMLAVGLGLDGLTEYADSIGLGKDVVIACQNSPESLTLSGTTESIEYAKNVLTEARIFARELPTGKAYHSSQMQSVASVYNTLLATAITELDENSLSWRQERTRWFSSVNGSEYLDNDVPASYWSQNLLQRVLFDEAVAALGTASGLEQVRVAIEIGPHATLSGPFKQICRAEKLDRFTYIPSLIRNQDSARHLLITAGMLFLQGYKVDLEQVNSIESSTELTQMPKNGKRSMFLVDLPPYQWGTENTYWTEPRLSGEQRHLTHPRHDLLGSKIVGLSDRSLAWRNELRHADLPWLKDHKLGKESVFPAAAHLSMAAEALHQVCDLQDIEVRSVTFRDVQLSTALIIPEADNGIETQLRLMKLPGDGMWFEFAVESIVDGQWTLHSTGSLAPNHAESDALSVRPHPVDIARLTQRTSGKTWYNAFGKVGFEYGPSFQPVSNVRTNNKYHHAAADVEVATSSGLMIGESRYLLHPSTIDGCLQLVIVSINAGAYKDMPHGVVPINFEELTIHRAGESCTGKAVAWTDEVDGRLFNTHTKLVGETGDVLLDVTSLRCIAYEVAVPQIEAVIRPREPYMQTVWTPISNEKEPRPEPHTRGEVMVVTSSALPALLHIPLVESLQGHGCAVQVVDISSVENLMPASALTCIVFDPTGEMINSLSSKTFDQLKAVLAGKSPVIWLTFGVNEGQSVAGAMAKGMLRTLRSEQASARIVLLDADNAESLAAVTDALLQAFDDVPTKDSGKDTELWLHHGELHIPRVVANETLNAHFSAALAPPQPAILNSEHALSGKAEDGALVFTTYTEKQSLDATDVEMQIMYASVEADVASKASAALSIVAGPIRTVGSGLPTDFVGQNAIAYAPSAFDTTLKAPISVGAFYSDIEVSSLVALLPSLAKAMNAVSDVGNAQAGEHVVLLPASQDFVRAVYELRQAIGFKLTIIVESEQQRSELANQWTLGPGEVFLSSDNTAVRTMFSSGKPDLVIAQNFSAFSQESWRSMPPGSRFILNDSTVTGHLDALPFSNGVSFQLSGVETMYKRRRHLLGDLLQRTIALIKNYNIAWIPVVRDIESFTDLRASPQAQGSAQNTVIQYNYGVSSLLVKPRERLVQFSADAAYFLVGCLGGLGRSLTTFMMERGAGDFVFLSRSGTDKPDAAALVESIRKAGARVQVFRGDASIQQDVDEVVSQVTAERAIKGVVHAAMVLQDGVFDNMNYEQFEAAIRPKVAGAQTLHKAFQGDDLDFFVMTSSISATMGNPGQANYSAANSYLDALAWSRNLQGLPGTSLILPMILGVGVVAENTAIEEALNRKAMYGIDEQELLRGFETAMLPNARTVANSQIILGLEPAMLANAIGDAGDEDAYWYKDARFSQIRDVVDEIRAAAKTSGSSRQTSFAQVIKQAEAEGADAVLRTLSAHIAAKLSSMLLIPIEQFAFEGKSIAIYGIDSMIGANLRNWLFSQFALEMPFSTLLAPTMSISALATVVGEHMGVLVQG